MSITIVCTGTPEQALAGKYNSEGFDAAVLAAGNSKILPYSGRKYDPEGRRVLCGEGQLCADTLSQLVLPCEAEITPLANEIPLRSFTDTEKEYPAETWLRKAAAQRKHADPRQPESREEIIRRADQLIELMTGSSCILVTGPLFLTELLDRFRVHNFVIQRTGMMKIQPLERFVISRKEDHCGGCQHNCFLANPGCGIGRDKAMRKGIKISAPEA